MNKKRLTVYLFLIAIAFLFTVFIIFFRPINIGGDTRYEPVLTGSMEPAIPVGGIVLIKPVKSELIEIGNIICFRFSESTLITHRVVDITNDGFVTKGDANEETDLKTVNKKDVVGKVAIVLPLVGYIGSFAQTPIGFILFLLVPATSIIIYELRNIILELKKNGKKQETRVIAEKNGQLIKTKDSYERLMNYVWGLSQKFPTSKLKAFIGPIFFVVGVSLFIYSSMVIVGHEQILNSSNLAIEEIWRYEGALRWWRNSYINIFLPLATILVVMGISILIVPFFLRINRKK